MGYIYNVFYNFSLYSADKSADILQAQPAQMDMQVVSSENRESQGLHKQLQA